MKFASIDSLIDASQWYKNGDHLSVRYFRHPQLLSIRICTKCLKAFHHHGWIDQGKEGMIVCPGDYIITFPGIKDVYVSMSEYQFRTTYIRVIES